MYHRVIDAITEARRRVPIELKTITVFKQDDEYGVMSLGDWLDAEMWNHGAKQICSFTMNGAGKVV